MAGPAQTRAIAANSPTKDAVIGQKYVSISSRRSKRAVRARKAAIMMMAQRATSALMT